MALAPGMALGFFNLGPRTHMSGEIWVPSFLGGSQNLGDPPLTNSLCCCYEKEWLANYCHTVNKALLSFFLFENINFSIEMFLLMQNFRRTFVIHLTHVTNKCRSLEILHPLVNAFFFPAFLQSLQIINKSLPEPLVCSYPNSFSHLSRNWLCLPPFSWFIAILQAYVSGHFTSTIYQTMNKHGGAHSSFPDV